MTKRPKLAIVGRPNVGKSALFNRIVGKQIAIVDEEEGVTRDRLYADTEFFGLPIQVIDTGGIGAQSLTYNEEIRRQAEVAIEEADTIVLVVDSRVGVTDLDQEIAKILLRRHKPLCVAVNKVDNHSQLNAIHQFHSLGIKKLIGVSAIQGLHIAELLETAFETIEKPKDIESDYTIKIAIVGHPNVGKSTLINTLLNENRCIVSPIAGTTRDSIDSIFHYNDVAHTLIDTAGIRRKRSEHNVIDKFAAIRTKRAIERSHICIFMIDANTGITTREKQIANLINDAGKGCIIFFNKWDLVKGIRMEHCLKDINNNVPFLSHCPLLFGSALKDRNLDKIFSEVNIVYEQYNRRINTHDLNNMIAQALQKNYPPMITGKRLKVYYTTQFKTSPPQFIMFVNRPNLMTNTYKKYLYNQIRMQYGFSGVPFTLSLRGKKSRYTELMPTKSEI